MELYEQILREAIAQDVIPRLRIDPVQLIEARCYQAILRIYQIIGDETLEDPDCFHRIEEIVTTLDRLGIGGGGRHDF